VQQQLPLVIPEPQQWEHVNQQQLVISVTQQQHQHQQVQVALQHQPLPQQAALEVSIQEPHGQHAVFAQTHHIN